MLRTSILRLSLGGCAPTPFVNAALQLCELHKQHRNIREENVDVVGGDDHSVVDQRRAAAVARELDAIQQEFAERIETLRPIFHASRALASNRMYSAKIFNALRYFGMEDDPMYAQLAGIIGALKHAPKQAQQLGRAPHSASSLGGKEEEDVVDGDHSTRKSTAGTHRTTWTELASLPARHGDKGTFVRKRQVDDAVQRALFRVKGGCSRFVARAPEFHPSELPAPNPDEIGREVADDPHVPQMSFRNRGHWVLREPGIVASRNTRKMDPW